MAKKRVCEICGTVFDENRDVCPLCDTPYRADLDETQVFSAAELDEAAAAGKKKKQKKQKPPQGGAGPGAGLEGRHRGAAFCFAAGLRRVYRV